MKKLSPYMIRKGLLYLRHYGLKEFLIRLKERTEPEEVPYGPWYENYRPKEAELARQAGTVFPDPVTISVVVPAYRTPPAYLKQMAESLLAQTYPYWELCIANASPEDGRMLEILRELEDRDKRIRVRNLEKNLSIAENTNAALDMAGGDWIGFLDHDDMLAPWALYTAACAVSRCPQADMVYSDEDKIRGGDNEHFQPHFKPDFNPDLLRSNNYICHFFLVRKDLRERVGYLSPEYDGAQDYDYILRCSEKAGQILHIPEILYHWRVHEASSADNPASKMYAYEAGRRAIDAQLSRLGIKGAAEHTPDYGFYRVRYQAQSDPLVSVLIPNKDHPELLKRCIGSILEKTSYQHYEIWIIENNSEGKEIFALYDELERDERIRVLQYSGSFNFSAINNFAARQVKGDLLLFLNNDTVVTKEDWMSELVSQVLRPEIGAAGAKLLYPDGRIQHAGIVVGMGGIAGAMFVDMPSSRTGYLHKASLLQDMSAVTAACLLVRREVFEMAGGFTEELSVAFNDVDLCLKIREKGFYVLYDPYVVLTHDESRSRGPEDDEKKIRRFQSEIEYMRTHWIGILRGGDPFYNKNLSLSKWNYSLKPDVVYGRYSPRTGSE